MKDKAERDKIRELPGIAKMTPRCDVENMFED
jgi:hypothetical protein